jgi:hypothetical protein
MTPDLKYLHGLLPAILRSPVAAGLCLLRPKDGSHELVSPPSHLTPVCHPSSPGTPRFRFEHLTSTVSSRLCVLPAMGILLAEKSTPE